MSAGKGLDQEDHVKWAEQVHRFLKSGFGTEDIAVMMNCKIVDVKAEVESLRKSGELDKIYGVFPHE